MTGIVLLIGEKARAIGNQEPNGARVRLVDVREVELVQYSLTEGVPDSVRRRGRRADSGLGAGSPAGLASGAARRRFWLPRLSAVVLFDAPAHFDPIMFANSQGDLRVRADPRAVPYGPTKFRLHSVMPVF